MSRRRAIYCGSALAFVLAGLTSLWLWTRETVHITRENFERIQIGMTQKDVEEILGGPPGDYRQRKSIEYEGRSWHELIIKVQPTPASHPMWWGTRGAIQINLTEEGQVREKVHFDPIVIETTFWDRIRSWRPF